jgi:hypothetical protein
MITQTTHNCHYVSRLLTTPWEGAQRFLRFYDFDTDRFEVQSSRSLFAAENINSPAVETWLGRMVETPLGAIRRQIAHGDTERLESNWPNYRAAMLMIFLQGARMRTISDQDARRHLEALAAMPDPELNVLVMDMMRTYDLRLMHTVSNHDNTAYAPLYMPSTGMFRTIVRDHGCLSGHSIGLGLPIDVTCALIATPTERHGNLEMAPTRKALSSASIGTSTARRVVLVPGLYEQDGEERLRGMLRELRRNNDTLIEITDEKRRLVRAAFAETGIDVGRDAAGRIPPGSRR